MGVLQNNISDMNCQHELLLIRFSEISELWKRMSECACKNRCISSKILGKNISSLIFNLRHRTYFLGIDRTSVLDFLRIAYNFLGYSGQDNYFRNFSVNYDHTYTINTMYFLFTINSKFTIIGGH